MKIALLTDGIWPFVIGGMQRHSYYLCKYLAQNSVYVVLYHTSRNSKIPDLSTCFSYEELNYIEQVYVEYPISDKFPGHYLRSSLKYSERIFDKIRSRKDLDIIYAKGLSAWKLLKEKKTKQFPPVCLNVHGYEYYQKAGSLRAKLQQYMLRPAFRFNNIAADYIFSYGGGISDIIRRYIPGSEKKIIEIPAAIERKYLVDRPNKNNNIRKLVFLGRFERRKGVQELMKALVQVQENGLKYCFYFVGPIPEKFKINNDFIDYLGEVKDGDRIRSILRDSDILVCPSHAEGMPNVILEAMASGCAIIASDVGAVSLQVNSNNGWLVKPGSKDQLQKAITESLSVSNEDLTAKKWKSLEKVQIDFVWENLIGRVIDAFSLIILEQKGTYAK